MIERGGFPLGGGWLGFEHRIRNICFNLPNLVRTLRPTTDTERTNRQDSFWGLLCEPRSTFVTYVLDSLQLKSHTIDTHIHMYIHLCIYVYTCSHIRVCTYTYVYAYTYTHIDIYTHIIILLVQAHALQVYIRVCVSLEVLLKPPLHGISIMAQIPPSSPASPRRSGNSPGSGGGPRPIERGAAPGQFDMWEPDYWGIRNQGFLHQVPTLDASRNQALFNTNQTTPNHPQADFKYRCRQVEAIRP